MEIVHCELAYGDRHDGRCTWCGEPVPPRRRRFCSALCSHLFAENHYWSTARPTALALAGYACTDELCSATELTALIEVHHLSGPPGRARYGHGCHNHQSNLAVLCNGHHWNETRWERARGRPVQLALVGTA